MKDFWKALFKRMGVTDDEIVTLLKEDLSEAQVSEIATRLEAAANVAALETAGKDEAFLKGLRDPMHKDITGKSAAEFKTFVKKNFGFKEAELKDKNTEEIYALTVAKVAEIRESKAGDNKDLVKRVNDLETDLETARTLATTTQGEHETAIEAARNEGNEKVSAEVFKIGLQDYFSKYGARTEKKFSGTPALAAHAFNAKLSINDYKAKFEGDKLIITDKDGAHVRKEGQVAALTADEFALDVLTENGLIAKSNGKPEPEGGTEGGGGNGGAGSGDHLADAKAHLAQQEEEVN